MCYTVRSTSCMRFEIPCMSECETLKHVSLPSSNRRLSDDLYQLPHNYTLHVPVTLPTTETHTSKQRLISVSFLSLPVSICLSSRLCVVRMRQTRLA